MQPRLSRPFVVSVALLLGLSSAVFAQSPDVPGEPGGEAPAVQTDGSVPVTFEGQPVLSVSDGLGPFSAQERAAVIESRIARVARERFEADQLHVSSEEPHVAVYYGDELLVVVTAEDAAARGLEPDELGEQWRSSIEKLLLARVPPPPPEITPQDLLTRARHLIASAWELGGLFQQVVLSAGLLVALLIAIWIIARVFTWIYDHTQNLLQRWERPIMLGKRELLSPRTIRLFLSSLLRFLHLLVTLLLVLFAANQILGLFPDSEEWPIKIYLRGLIYAILVTVLAISVIRTSNGIAMYLSANARRWPALILRAIRFKGIELLGEERIAAIIDFFLMLLRWAVRILLAYLYLAIVLSFFPLTQQWTGILVSYISEPISATLASLVDFLPNIFFIVIIVLITRYAIKATKLVFSELERGRVSIPGFYPEWANPTYRLLSIVLIAFAGVIMFPYLPGSGSDAFKGISLFVGFVLSLSSSAVIANVIAGIVVTYMRPFQIGDRVQISDTVGDVVEKSLLVTRIRTVKNVDITIPNAMVLASHIINYSSSAQDPGLILHTTVTIGYDVDWRTVHKLLIEAAKSVADIEATPEPFVLQTSLDDYYVSYELNAYTEKPNRMAALYSELHTAIQEKFHAGGVEIMSPHFYALRDGSAANIPAQHLGRNYQPPAFRVSVEQKATKKPRARR